MTKPSAIMSLRIVLAKLEREGDLTITETSDRFWIEAAIAAIAEPRRQALEEAARVAERIWDTGQQGAHGAGKRKEPCATCGGRGWVTTEQGGHNCRCSNLRCIKCGGEGRKIEPKNALQ